MRKIFSFFIPIIILGGLAYQFRGHIFGVFSPIPPCTKPIPYTLGTFDAKFNISKKYFLEAVAQAETIWENPKGDHLGKNLFVYSPTNTSKSVLKINLIYDYRQQAPSKLADL